MDISDIYSTRKKKWLILQRMRLQAEKQNVECKRCGLILSKTVWKEQLYVCPECGNYHMMPAMERMRLICDEGTFEELFSQYVTCNPIDFEDYEEKLEQGRKRTKRNSGFLCGKGRIHNLPIAIGILDGNFMMGSLGSAEGEKIALLAEHAKKERLPLIIFSASGGARMQEGLFSLMQMAKTAAAIQDFKTAGGLFISCLTHPTTGGVSASYASLGDIMIAEPDALIGFAGPRVIEQTIGEKLPEGFQHSEFLLEHGMIDRIAQRHEWKELLFQLLLIHRG